MKGYRCMKRVILAAALLLIVAAGCISSIWLQVHQTDYLLGLLDEISDAYEREDRTTCIVLTDQFADEYVRRTKYFPFFMRHSDLTKIEETAVVLPVMIRKEWDDHFPSELVRCRNQLEKLSELELPELQNIL